MLVLSRKNGESIILMNDIIIKVLEIKSGVVKLGIKAPKEIKIWREEIFNLSREVKDVTIPKSDKSNDLGKESGRLLP
jgi:carbon storage regulator